MSASDGDSDATVLEDEEETKALCVYNQELTTNPTSFLTSDNVQLFEKPSSPPQTELTHTLAIGGPVHTSPAVPFDEGTGMKDGKEQVTDSPDEAGNGPASSPSLLHTGLNSLLERKSILSKKPGIKGTGASGQIQRWEVGLGTIYNTWNIWQDYLTKATPYC